MAVGAVMMVGAQAAWSARRCVNAGADRRARGEDEYLAIGERQQERSGGVHGGRDRARDRRAVKVVERIGLSGEQDIAVDHQHGGWIVRIVAVCKVRPPAPGHRTATLAAIPW